MKKVVVLGIGNILLNDEGIGVVVLQELQKRFYFDESVELVDGGTGGLLLLQFIEEAEKLLVIDAITCGGKPGTIYKFNAKEIPEEVVEKISMHEVSFIDILNLCKIRNKLPSEVVIIGVEPKSLEMEGRLSKEVKAKIPELIDEVISQLKEWNVKVKEVNPQRAQGS
ncbi:MAG: HyaD/HybD family hydrogenase maturation endopeptidase [Thermodesulfobacteria bacterium]|nr:HyaD/HybD family hydrogenase maturation endopeptidase [Thermodesulfobacteriota bacterium]